MAHKDNLVRRARKVQRMVGEHYEEGNLRKCKSQVYRRIVKEAFPISLRTFWRYMSTDTSSMKNE